MRQPGAVLLRRQGLARAAAPGREGVPPGALPVPAAAHRYRPQFRRGDRLPRCARRRTGRAPDRALGRRFDSPRNCSFSQYENKAETRRSRSRCWRRSRSSASTPRSAARGATRRRRAPRSGCSPSATSSASGTRRTSAPSCGTCTTRACTRASTCACSRSPTGPSWTSGSTSSGRSWRCPRSTTRTGARWCAGTVFFSFRKTRKKAKSCRFASVPSATSAAPARSNPLAADVASIIKETVTAQQTERGATRMDDQTSDASMERRKKEGYF